MSYHILIIQISQYPFCAMENFFPVGEYKVLLEQKKMPRRVNFSISDPNKRKIANKI